MKRALRNCVGTDDSSLVQELNTKFDVKSWSDLSFLERRQVDSITSIRGICLTKLHLLIELLHLDPEFNPENSNPVSVRHKLHELKTRRWCDLDKRTRNDTLYKYSVKIELPKFNGQVDS